jgi:hypothetical protein
MPVNCNRCGSAVEVGPETRYVTCATCKTPLVVVHTPTSVFTDLVARQKELERIDREWEAEKRQYQVKDKNGDFRTPDEFVDAHILFGGCFTFVGFILAGLVLGRGQPEGLLLLLFSVVGVAFGLYGWRAAKRYWAAETRYRARRIDAEHRPWDGPAG